MIHLHGLLLETERNFVLICLKVLSKKEKYAEWTVQNADPCLGVAGGVTSGWINSVEY